MMVFEFDVLAGEVRGDGGTIRLSRGELALMLLLALQRRPCNRAELIEWLYPHLDEATAATQLKVYVHRIRRRLGDMQALVFDRGSYALGPNVWVDFWDVETEVASALRSKGSLDPVLRARLERLRARLLRRNLCCGTEREWEISFERRISMLAFDVAVRLGEAALAERDFEGTSRLAAEIANLDPCDERGAELAIRAHILEGNRDGALRQLRRYERVLREEFAAKPSAELYALARVPAIA